MVGWMRSLLTFQPITSASFVHVFFLYLHYTTLGFMFAIPLWMLLHSIGIPHERKNVAIGSLLWIIPVEDFLFRALPLWIFGKSGGVFAHLIWALIHGPYGFPFVVIHGLLELRLWLGGLWIPAVLVHFLHDLFFLVLWKMLEEDLGEI